MKIKALSELFLKEVSIRYPNPETGRFNSDQVKAILKWCETVSIEDVEQLNKVVAISFIDFMRNNNYTESTISKRFGMFKRLVKYCIEDDIVDDVYKKEFNKILSIKLKQPTYKSKDTLTQEQVNKLKEYIDTLQITQPHTFRLKVMLLICLSTGVRMTELAYIEQSNIDIDTGAVYLAHTKTNTPRTVFLSDNIKPLVKIYMQMYPSKYLFAKNTDGSRLTADNLSCIFKRVSQKVGFNVSPHILRHTYATLLVQKGLDLETLRITLGHTSLRTTQRYLLMNEEFRRAALQKFSII